MDLTNFFFFLPTWAKKFKKKTWGVENEQLKKAALKNGTRVMCRASECHGEYQTWSVMVTEVTKRRDPAASIYRLEYIKMGPKGECERPTGISFRCWWLHSEEPVNDQVSLKGCRIWKPIWPRAEIMTATGKQSTAFPSMNLLSLTSAEKMKGWWGAVREASRPCPWAQCTR